VLTDASHDSRPVDPDTGDTDPGDAGNSGSGDSGSGDSGSSTGDGRRARRERNRDAVVEALLQFYREGELAPSTDQIAARAGLSPRSLFRYFDDVDELCRIAIDHQRQRIQHLFVVEIDPSIALPERAARFVDRRVELYEAQSGVGLVARARAPYQPLIAAELRRRREVLRQQLAQVFAPELDSLEPELRDRLVAAADVQCSFEAYRLLLDDQGLDRHSVIAVLTEALVRLVDHPST
jgi:AcrR family transcriptional regulator